MVPRIAMPSVPPSSAPVSLMPEAAPACSSGAEPTISAVVRPNTGARPSETELDEQTNLATQDHLKRPLLLDEARVCAIVRLHARHDLHSDAHAPKVCVTVILHYVGECLVSRISESPEKALDGCGIGQPARAE